VRSLPTDGAFAFIEYGPIQLYLDQGYAYVTMDVPGTGRSEGKWDPVAREEGEAIHEMIEHVAQQDWCTGNVGMIGISYYCWSQWNTARTKNSMPYAAAITISTPGSMASKRICS